jgi:hypothetical protein
MIARRRPQWLVVLEATRVENVWYANNECRNKTKKKSELLVMIITGETLFNGYYY